MRRAHRLLGALTAFIVIVMLTAGCGGGGGSAVGTANGGVPEKQIQERAGDLAVINSTPTPTPSPSPSPSGTGTPTPTPSVSPTATPTPTPTPPPLATPTPTPGVENVNKATISDFPIPNPRGLGATGRTVGVCVSPQRTTDLPGTQHYWYTIPDDNKIVQMDVRTETNGRLIFSPRTPVNCAGTPTRICYTDVPPIAVTRGVNPGPNAPELPPLAQIWVTCPGDNTVKGFDTNGTLRFTFSGIAGDVTGNPGGIAQSGAFDANAGLLDITPLDDGSLLITENAANQYALIAQTKDNPKTQFGGPGIVPPDTEDRQNFQQPAPQIFQTRDVNGGNVIPNSGPWGVIENAAGVVGSTQSQANLIGHGILLPDAFTFPTVVNPTEIAADTQGSFWFIEEAVNQLGFTNITGNSGTYTAPSPNALLKGIALGNDSNIWFTESALNRVAVVGTNQTGGRGSFVQVRLQQDAMAPGVMSKQILLPSTAPNIATAFANNFIGFGATATDSQTLAILRPDATKGEEAISTITNVPGFVNGFLTNSSPSGPLAPAGVVVADGKLYVCEFFSNQIDELTLPTPTAAYDGGTAPSTVLRRFGLPNAAGTATQAQMDAALPNSPGGVDTGPYAICLGPDNNLWFTMQTANKIGRLTTAGVLTVYNVPTANARVSGITAGPNDDVFFVESTANKIGRVANVSTNPTITEIPIPTAAALAQNICLGPDGNVWFTEQTGANNGRNPQIGRVNADLTITEFGGASSQTPITGGSNPFGIAAGPDGNVWFTETSGNRIGKITPAGVVTEFAIRVGAQGQDDIEPRAIIAGPDGNVWFTELTGGRVGGINPTTGAVLEVALQAIRPGSYGMAVIPANPAAFKSGAVIFTQTDLDKLGVITLGDVNPINP